MADRADEGRNPAGLQGPRHPDSRTRTHLLTVIAVILAGAALHWLKPVALPLVIAAFLIAVAWPVQRGFERHVPPGLAYLATSLCIAALLLGLAGTLLAGIAALAAGLPDYAEEFRNTADMLRERAVKLGVPMTDIQLWQGEQLGQLVTTAAGAVYEGIRLMAIAFVFAVLGLIELRAFGRRLARSLTPERNGELRAAASQMARRFRSALAAYTAVSLLTGILTWVFAVAIGLDFALVWGILAFILNYILFVGPIVAVILPGLFALIQFQSIGMCLAALGGLGLMQFVIGNYLLPRLEGRAVSVSPFLVMLSLVFWMLVWGVPGAVMAVPLTVALLMACERTDGMRWVSVVFRSPHDRTVSGRER